MKRSSGEVDDDAGATQVDEGDERLAERKPKLRPLTSLIFESDSQWPRGSDCCLGRHAAAISQPRLRKPRAGICTAGNGDDGTDPRFC